MEEYIICEYCSKYIKNIANSKTGHYRRCIK